MQPNAKLAKAIEALQVASSEGGSAYLTSYQDHYRALHSLETLGNRRIAEIKRARASEGIEAVKVAVLLNDTTFLSLDGSSMVAHWLTAEGAERLLGTKTFEVICREPIDESLRKALENGQLALGFLMADGDSENAAVKSLGPLIEQGAAIPRPSRVLFYLQETRSDGSRTWGTVESPLGGKFDTWDIRHSTSSADDNGPPIAIEFQGAKPDQERHLCEIILPFLSAISISDLALILEDERDVLDEFRAGIRVLVSEASNGGANIERIANDVVRPKIGKIERRFAKIAGMNRLRLSGAVMSVATLSLASYLTSGIGSAMLALGGATGLTYLTKEYASGKGEIADLKDDPAYLLWRIQRFTNK